MAKITRTNTSNYPDKFDANYNYPVFSDGITSVIGRRINDLKDAITTIEITIGANPITSDYTSIGNFLSEVSSQNFVEQIGDVITGDLEFHSFGNNMSSRLFLGTNCNCSIVYDEFSSFPGKSGSIDVGTKWMPSSIEDVDNQSGVVPLSIIGSSIFGITSAGSARINAGHKVRIFNDVENRGALFVSGTLYSPMVTETPVEEINLSDTTAPSFLFDNVESHGSIKADDRLDFIGSEFSRSLEDDGPPTVTIPANSGYEVLVVMFSAYLPYKSDRGPVECDGLKLRLNDDRINDPSLFAPFDPDKTDSLNNVSLMNVMVIPSTAVTENAANEFIVKFDPSIENRISLVRDRYTVFRDYPTLMHMVTVFGQRSGCYDIIHNDSAPASFGLTQNLLGDYIDFDGTKYTVD